MRRALLIVLAVLLTACTAPATRTSPPTAPATSPAPTTTPPPSLDLPPRPREIRLDGLDPCALLTPQQRATLGLARPTVPFRATAPGFEGPACTVRGFEPRAIALATTLSVANSVDVLAGPGAKDDLSPITVGGFPALLARQDRFPEFCSVDIDVAEGQFIDVQFRDGGREPPIPQDQLCRDAVTVAEQIMQNLLTR